MRYVTNRLMRLVPVLVIVTFFSFLLLELIPGDVAARQLGLNATEQEVAERRHELGLNDPLPTRYVRWLGDAVTGDLGDSLVNDLPVAQALRQRVGVTLELLVASQLLALALSIPLGILAARRPRGWLDRTSSAVTFAFMAVPNFILGVVLVLVFAVRLGWFPATSLPPVSEAPGEHFRSLVLPTVSLTMGSLAGYLRLLRTDMINTLQQDFILNAKAKGLPEWWILVRHALRPSSFSLLTVAGLTTGALIGGALIIEVIFVLPGMGSLAVSAINGRDYPMVQGFVLVVAVGYVLINFLVDMLYAALDPRIRHARSEG